MSTVLKFDRPTQARDESDVVASEDVFSFVDFLFNAAARYERRGDPWHHWLGGRIADLARFAQANHCESPEDLDGKESAYIEEYADLSKTAQVQDERIRSLLTQLKSDVALDW